jgi:parallel beta-helix repeat protein
MKKFIKKMLWLSPIVIAIALNSGCKEDSEVVIENQPQSNSKLKAGTIEQANYYVQVNGNDANPGTYDRPFKTVEKAVSVALPGNLIYIRGGEYRPASLDLRYGFRIANKKSTGNKIRIFNYPGEKPVFNCFGMTKSDESIFGLAIENCENLHIKGIEVKYVPQNRDLITGQGYYNVGLLVSSTNCIIENCKVREIGGSGINVGGSSNNVILKNCDAYNCYDPYTYLNGKAYPGGHADGIHITLGSNPDLRITVIGCRTWNCSDDGIDNYGTAGRIDYINCWSWHNGYIPGTETPIGDGYGFKLGGGVSINYLTTTKRSLRNCIAAFNKFVGIHQNFDTGICSGINLNHCAVYMNQYGLGFGRGTASDTIRNCISFGNTVGNSLANFVGHTNLMHDHNSFDTNGIIVNENDFLSVTMSWLSAARQENGDLPVTNFLKLVSGSDLIGKGTNQSNLGLE